MRESILNTTVSSTAEPIPMTAVRALRVIAFDPSIRKLGWGVIERDRVGRTRRIDSGTWSPSVARGALDRFDQLASFVVYIVGMHCDHDGSPDPVPVVVEQPNKHQKRSAADLMTYAKSIGVIEGALYTVDDNIRVVRCTPLQWKRNAGKDVTLRQVKLELGYTAADDNEADALGMATWYAANARTHDLVAAINKRK